MCVGGRLFRSMNPRECDRANARFPSCCIQEIKTLPSQQQCLTRCAALLDYDEGAHHRCPNSQRDKNPGKWKIVKQRYNKQHRNTTRAGESCGIESCVGLVWASDAGPGGNVQTRAMCFVVASCFPRAFGTMIENEQCFGNRLERWKWDLWFIALVGGWWRCYCCVLLFNTPYTLWKILVCFFHTKLEIKQKDLSLTDTALSSNRPQSAACTIHKSFKVSKHTGNHHHHTIVIFIWCANKMIQYLKFSGFSLIKQHHQWRLNEWCCWFKNKTQKNQQHCIQTKTLAWLNANISSERQSVRTTGWSCGCTMFSLFLIHWTQFNTLHPTLWLNEKARKNESMQLHTNADRINRSMLFNAAAGIEIALISPLCHTQLTHSRIIQSCKPSTANFDVKHVPRNDYFVWNFGMANKTGRLFAATDDKHTRPWC